MKKEHTLFQLKEAQEAISQIITDFERDADYGEGDLMVDIGHVYHHLNTAWNARNESPAKTTKCAHTDFRKWRQFPKDIDLDA